MNPTRNRHAQPGLACLLAIGLLAGVTATATTLRLTWNPNTESDIAGYRLYAGTSEGSYTTSMDVGSATETEVIAPPHAAAMYFAVTAYNSLGLESPFSDPLQIDLTASSENRAPEIAVNPVVTTEDTPIPVLVTVTDPDAGLASILTTEEISYETTTIIVSGPTNGTLTGSAPEFLYTPHPNFYGTDSFKVSATDGLDTSAVVTVPIQVSPVNDAPIAIPGSRTVNEEAAASITLTGTDVEGSPLTYRIERGPSFGILTGTPPNLTYQGALEFSGIDSFTFSVSDGSVRSDHATITINVVPVNDTPQATPAAYSLAEDALLPIALSATDEDSVSLAYSITQHPSKGTLTGTPPNVFYRPNTNYHGTDSFRFAASDGSTTSPSATIQLTISPVNDAPISAPASVSTEEDASKSINLFGMDPDGDSLSFTIQQSPSNGTLSGSGSSVTYTPNLHFHGTDSFRYFVTDSGGLRSATNTVTIAITSVNQAPTATAIAVTIPEDTSGNITLSGTDPDGDSLSFTIIQAPVNGTVSGTPPNLVYQAKKNYSGSDVIRFTVSDGSATSAPANVSITIPAVNDEPIAYGGTRSVNEEGLVSFTLTGSDVEGSSLTYQITRAPAHGTLSGTLPSVAYRGGTNFFGTDSFEFTVSDGSLTSAPATYTINVVNVNDRPVAISQSISAEKNSSTPITLGASDADGDRLNYTITSAPLNGTLSGTPPNVTYTPKANFVGTDSFRFAASDAFVTSLSGTISLDVSESSSRPTAIAALVEVVEDTPKTFVLAGFDPSGRALTYSVTVQPTNGTLTGTAPNLVYTPHTNVSGSDSLLFQVSNGISNATATVQFTIAAVNDRPTATSMSVTVAEDNSLPLTISGSDVESPTLNFGIVTPPSHGSLIGTAPSLTYVPNPNYHGPDSFEFTTSDGALTSSPALVSISVTPVNDAPTSVAASVALTEDSSASLLLTGLDVDGDTITFTVLTGPSKGSLSGTAPNLIYTPLANATGEDRIEFVVRDATTASAPAAITLNITAVNDAPTANSGRLVVESTSAVPLVLTGSDVEGSPLTFAVTQGPTKGTLSGTAPNLTYTPNAGFSGSDQVQFTVSDGELTSSPATMTISSGNQPPTATPLAVTIPEDTSGSVTLAGTDPDGDPLTFTIVQAPAYGSFTGTPPNLIYRAKTNYSGKDSFRFTVSDGKSTSASERVNITIPAVNDPPVAYPFSRSINEEGLLSFYISGTDAEGSKLTYRITRPPANGTISGTPPNNLAYRGGPNFAGIDSFEYVVNDGSLDSAPATFTITVLNVNDRPVALNQSVATLKDSPISLVLQATDVDGDELTYGITSQPLNGSLSGTLPNVVYTPKANFTGTDSFRFNVSDGNATALSATVSITVKQGVLTLPDAVVLLPGSTTTVLASGADSVLANDRATDGTIIASALVNAPANGTLALTATGTFSYTHNGATNLLETATYRATSSSGLVSTNGVLSIHVFRVLGGEVTSEGTELEFSIVKGLAYTLEALDTAPEPGSVWNAVATFTAEVTGVASVVDTEPGSDTDRYYRIRCVLGGEQLVTEPWLRAGAIALP